MLSLDFFLSKGPSISIPQRQLCALAHGAEKVPAKDFDLLLFRNI